MINPFFIARPWFPAGRWSIATALLCLAFATTALASSPEKKILYNFTGGADGSLPHAGVVEGAAGVLYSTASNGGSDVCVEGGSCGVIYSLTPPEDGGSWTEDSLYTFASAGGVPTAPTTGVALDSKGNLYGIVQSYVYQLVPTQGGGSWTFNTLYQTGSYPLSAVPALDSAGDLYIPWGGVTELTPNTDGTWTPTIVSTGQVGDSSLIMDEAGQLYGATTSGGAQKCGSTGSAYCGSIFGVSPQPDGTWIYRTLYSFSNNETGFAPYTSLARDADGNLYGIANVTNSKCANQTGCTVLFEVSPPAVEGEAWTEAPLHLFVGGKDGFLPLGAPSVDSKGNVYGTTSQGGTGLCSGEGCGTVYQLKPPTAKGGAWTETLYSFQGGSDGWLPEGGVFINERANAIYSTTLTGGAYNEGTVFEVIFP